MNKKKFLATIKKLEPKDEDAQIQDLKNLTWRHLSKTTIYDFALFCYSVKNEDVPSKFVPAEWKNQRTLCEAVWFDSSYQQPITKAALRLSSQFPKKYTKQKAYNNLMKGLAIIVITDIPSPDDFDDDDSLVLMPQEWHDALKRKEQRAWG